MLLASPQTHACPNSAKAEARISRRVLSRRESRQRQRPVESGARSFAQTVDSIEQPMAVSELCMGTPVAVSAHVGRMGRGLIPAAAKSQRQLKTLNVKT